MKNCPENKILNPKTNRCVNITGILGKKILKQNNINNSKTLLPNFNTKNISNDNIIILDKINNNRFYKDINNLITIVNRLKQYNILNNVLKKYDIKSSTQRCVKNDLDKYIDIEKILGKGSFGLVRLINIKGSNIKIALKEAKIPGISKKIIKDPFQIREFYFLINYINPLIINRKGPGFPYTYNYFICNNCNFKLDRKYIKNIKCAVSLSEIASGDLINFDIQLYQSNLDSNIIDDILFNIYFQAIYSIAVLHKYTGIIHWDIKKDNFLYYIVPKGGYWQYNINNDIFYLPNLGFIIILNDFGVSLSAFPNNNIFSIKPYNLIFGIINNNKYITTIPYPSLKRENTAYSKIKSYNLNNYKKYISSINIDFKKLIPNNNLYTPYFSYDIIDCIYMFNGSNKRTTQYGPHYGLTIYKYSNKFKETIRNLLQLDDINIDQSDYNSPDHLVWLRTKYNKLKIYEDAKFISAIHNLLFIFKNMYKNKPNNSSEILETYNF